MSKVSIAGGNNPNVYLTNDDTHQLKQYDWPGNVRELQNVIERAMILATGARLRLDLAIAYSRSESTSLEAQAPLASNSSGTGIVSSDKILRSQDLKHLERDSIVVALEHAHRRISGTPKGFLK